MFQRVFRGIQLQADDVWSQAHWQAFQKQSASDVSGVMDENSARSLSARFGRKVLRSYSSSFYAVTRFLPPDKKADVELVYAAVRYPDEVVDTFALSRNLKMSYLDVWQNDFEQTRDYPGIIPAVSNGISVIMAAFRDVMRRNQIPDGYYLSFLDAMRNDINSRRFSDWHDLIENYIYGSATVVGYFLTHIYGSAPGQNLDRCLKGARSLAIALQLTNFARDVVDDALRERCYVPEHYGQSSGSVLVDQVLSLDQDAMTKAQLILANEAAKWYQEAACDIDAFHPDSRLAIQACHRLYSRLNTKILSNPSATDRESLTMFEKLSVLPVSKYWRLPVALVLER